MKKLNEILPDIHQEQINGSTDILINAVQFDSRKVLSGDLYVAVRGTTHDGHAFIGKAIENGAVAVICETLPETLPEQVCFIISLNSQKTLGEVASAFFGHPSSKLKLIGVTGTNGKTSIATLLYQLFLSLGYATGLLSTIVNKINQREIPSTHTTPDPVNLNELLAKMVEEGCGYCFMEVSSHAIHQHRIAGLTFQGGIFTNLTHDHLDYHGNFQAYLAAKKMFFDTLPAQAFALINKDDRNGMVMVQNTKAEIHTFSTRGMANFRCKIIESGFDGMLLQMDGEEVWFRLIGKFNASNLLAVYAAARLLGEDKTTILSLLSATEPVAGRFNYIRGAGITAIIDYAHTPDALRNVLETIQEIRSGQEKVITVTGAGGNRDRSKRPVMAGIAASYSDRLILTSDNPRDEEPGEILREMRQGITSEQASRVLVIEQREEAIKTACALAQQGDIVLIAGKGHETYQEIRGVKYHFDDGEVVRGILGKAIGNRQ
jgi:UDP-N-acetylmuramoyl-L-alanyl-D-glutamate--2,6-diaminopimelate ligase